MTKKTQTLADGAAAKQPLYSAVAEAMLDKKAQNVLSLDLSRIEGAVASYFVLCHADSTTQVLAIAESVEEHVRQTLGEKPVRRQGFENSLWIVLDYVDVVAHIFQTELRSFYRLEDLWADAGQEAHEDAPPAPKTRATKKPNVIS
ncbi:MAG: ribosome silencing factor [Prevotellaceae bacterium]|jgi:ribosome-associated protein|nr:ribosome silencing factor [Prevotellaceae bacterium]